MTQLTARGALASVLGAPFDAATYRSIAYLLLGFPIGLAAFVLLTTGVSTTLGLSITLFGPVALLATLLAALSFAWVDAKLTNGLLGTDLDPAFPSTADGAVAFCKRLAFERTGYAGLAYLGWRALFGFAVFTLLTTLGSVSVSLLLAPLSYGGDLVVWAPGGWVAVDSIGGTLLAAVAGLVLGLCTLASARPLARLGVDVAAALVGERTADREDGNNDDAAA